MSETIKQRKVSQIIDHSEGALKEAIKFARHIKDPSLIRCIQRLIVPRNTKRVSIRFVYAVFKMVGCKDSL